LVDEIKADEDNLRFYRIAELKGYEVREHGCFRATDFDAPTGSVDLREPEVTMVFREVRASCYHPELIQLFFATAISRKIPPLIEQGFAQCGHFVLLLPTGYGG
jgi:hypothetical protein